MSVNAALPTWIFDLSELVGPTNELTALDCPECGNPLWVETCELDNKDREIFCSFCGELITVAEPNLQTVHRKLEWHTDMIACFNCEHDFTPVDPADKICPWCGYKNE